MASLSCLYFLTIWPRQGSQILTRRFKAPTRSGPAYNMEAAPFFILALDAMQYNFDHILLVIS